MSKSLVQKWLKFRQDRINSKNRKRLVNNTPTLICSNCTGGVLYHWLGLPFLSPFINLYMTNMDFIKAMENFDEFLATEIIEDANNTQSYPVGIGLGGVKLHFMHYKTFEEAIQKWNERKLRINKDNMCVWLTNFTPANYGGEENEIVDRFSKLPFKNKLIFSGGVIDSPNAVYLKDYKKVEMNKNIFTTQNILGKRFIDQFDYVSYFNSMLDNAK